MCYKLTIIKILQNFWLILVYTSLLVILWCPYLPTPPFGQDMTQGQFLSGVYQVWIQRFPSPRLVASPRAEEISLSYYLPIAGGIIIGFIPFPISAMWYSDVTSSNFCSTASIKVFGYFYLFWTYLIDKIFFTYL